MLDASTGQLLDDFEVQPEQSPQEALRQAGQLHDWTEKVVPRLDALQEAVNDVDDAVEALLTSAERAAQRVLDQATAEDR